MVLEGHYAYLHPTGSKRADAKLHGISYHGRSGWANDWVDNWASTKAHPYWHLNIVRSGDYRVVLKYACAEADAGSLHAGTVRLAKGNTQLRVRALEIPGAEALELKAVHLIRQH